jgi:phage terminase Nu1 subunit (DNA packaging protein)
MKANEVTPKQLAEEFQVTPRQVSHYVEQGMPKRNRGRYDRVACWRWRFERKEAEIRDRIDNLDKDEADARKKRLEGDKLEMELAKLRHELAPVEALKTAVERMIQAFRSRMLAIPTKVAARMLGIQSIQEARDIIETEIHQGLNELTTVAVDTSDLRSDSTYPSTRAESGGASPKADAKPVGRRKGHAIRRRKRRARKVQSRQS